MRYLTICLLLLGASSLGAMEAWRWTDKDGVVHFSDQPTPGAEKVQLNAAPKPGSVAPPRPQAPEGSPEPPFRYTGCSFSAPTDDQVFLSVDSVSASLQLSPGYRTGDRIQVTLNGQTVTEWPENALSYQFTGLARGAYELGGKVVDPLGRTMCTITGLSFNVLQPSLLTPGRAQAPRS